MKSAGVAPRPKLMVLPERPKRELKEFNEALRLVRFAVTAVRATEKTLIELGEELGIKIEPAHPAADDEVPARPKRKPQ